MDCRALLTTTEEAVLVVDYFVLPRFTRTLCNEYEQSREKGTSNEKKNVHCFLSF
ncbi:MAG: hypothetical protein LBP54_01130 [Campylobacteraceae bacterium]|nr:hypothetical protein [Campylobacteraceae bacterium]